MKIRHTNFQFDRGILKRIEAKELLLMVTFIEFSVQAQVMAVAQAMREAFLTAAAEGVVDSGADV